MGLEITVMNLEKFNNILIENTELVKNNHIDEINIILNNYNNQMEILDHYMVARTHDMGIVQNEYTKMLFSAIHKNLFSLYSAYDLTLKGLYGSARIIFRNIFEFLIISKAISIKNDISLLKKWENGDEISLRKEIFNKVKKPKSIEMILLWKSLCVYTHGTTFSQQIGYRYDKDEIDFNFILIKMLLDMNYHVLNSYAANSSIQYYTKYMFDHYETDMIINKKKIIRSQINSMRKTLHEEPKRAILDFISKWEFK